MRKLPTPSAFLDIYPNEWKRELNIPDTDILQFRNLAHWKSYCSKGKQIDDDKCGISYKEATRQLLTNQSTVLRADYDIIKNRVKQVLLKREMISDTLYRSYSYQVDGVGEIDVARFASNQPDCIMVPSNPENTYFYELFISVSYNYRVRDSEVQENLSKLVATIELLEQENYFCKVNMIFPVNRCNIGEGNPNLLVIVPVFSHREIKSIETLSAVINRFSLRKMMFNLLEHRYGDDLDDGYGSATTISKVINIGYELDEIELATNILSRINIPCTSR